MRVVLVLSLVLLPGRALAIHRNMPFLVAVTPTPGANHDAAPSQGQPHWLAFESSDDPLHTGSTGQQIFLMNSLATAGLECNSGKTPGPSLRQLTHFAEGAANPATSGGGRVVVFDSAADLIGNGSTLRKIFRWERDKSCFSDGPWPNSSGGTLTQLTDGSMDCVLPSIDASDEIIAFECQGSSGTQIVVYNTNSLAKPPTPIVTQVGAGTDPVLSYDGNVVVFDSAAALQADTPLPASASGHRQIYAYNRRLQRLFRLTSGADDSIGPSPGQLNPGEIWPLVAFQSHADLLGNGSTGWQIFLLDPDTGELRQITHPNGESVEPSLASLGDLISFLSTSDLLGTGTPGQHLFFFDLRLGRFFQVKADAGSMWAHPKAGGGNFVAFETTQDMFNTGVFGWQVYLLDTWGRVPKPFIGGRILQLTEGDAATGSRLKLKTQQWHTNVPMAPGGQVKVTIDLLDVRGQGKVTAAKTNVFMPPIPLPNGLGMLCIQPIGQGTGTWDCDGGLPGARAAGGDVEVTSDHNDPTCIGVCANVQKSQTQGEYAPGGMVVSLPVRVGVTQTLDGALCPSDLTRYEWSVETALLLTSGTATATIENADGQAGATVNVTETGEPFECRRMQAANFAGAALVGVLPILRVPDLPATSGQSTQDVVVSLRLQPYEGKVYRPCTGPWCDTLTPCMSASECDDGISCNGVETCATGPNTPPDGSLCLGLPACTDHACASGPQNCDDGNICNGQETCDAVAGCVQGAPATCDDGAVCTEDTCNPVHGCQSTAIPMCCASDADCQNTSLCDGAETCVNGDCMPGTPVACDDHDACNGVETCDPTTGACLLGAPPVCDDANTCTDDTCDPAVGCVHTPNATVTCDDGNPCTTNDVCANGVCLGTYVNCDDGRACNGLETCDPTTGGCVPGAPLNCDDGNPCTDDTCDDTLGCVHTPNSTIFCDDGNPCTTNDTCAAGICAGTPVVCDDGDACNGVETCDPGSGACVPGIPLVCDDGNPCTDDVCDPATGCLYPPNANSCDDGNPCTANDVCAAGVCGGTLVVCDNGNACDGVETCDPATGACLPGTPVSCDDGNPCTIDVCVPLNGNCTHTLDVLCQAGNLATEVAAANPADLGGLRQQRQFVLSLKVVSNKLERALAHRARKARRYRAAYRRLGLFQLALREGISRGTLDVPLANDLMSQTAGLMRALGFLISPGG